MNNSSQVTRKHSEWQQQLLPFMLRMTIVITAFFFVASLGQLGYLHWKISEAPNKSSVLLEEIQESIDGLSDERLAIAYEAVIALESTALERRYHQANVLLMSRVWTRYLGFVTGMTIALLGAVFLLGKLDAPETEVRGELEGIKLYLKSASPGITLVGFGTVLMIVTIIVHHTIVVEDRPIYTGLVTSQPAEEGSDAPSFGRPGAQNVEEDDQAE